MKRKNLLFILLLIVFTGIVLYITFKPVWQYPNSLVFSHGGDAIKSYYNFSWYLKYDSGINFDGNNYPYGDHLQYINSHPFHQAVLSVVKKVVPISNYGVAIINLSMLLSLLAAIPFIFLILRHYKLPHWYASIITLIILFLSPQLDRIQGHFEMVYLFFIPMFWYLLIIFRKGRKPWLWGSLLVTAGLIGGFTSAYYAAFYSIFLLAVLFADIINNWGNFKSFYKQGIFLFVIAIIPLIIVKGLVGITDWADVRPYNPWGFFIFHANKYSIFLPYSSELRSLIKNSIDISYEWEGRAYVGLPATLLALSMIYAFVHNLVTKKKNISLYIDKDLNTYLLGAFFVLLFSWCFPFIIMEKPFKIGMKFLLDILPEIKQFRALGRFSWIFYYVFTVYTAIFFYNLYLKIKAKGFVKFPVLFLSFVIMFWAFDATYNARFSFKKIVQPNNILESNDEPYLSALNDANVNIDDYQAILFLPFANTSGDKLYFERGVENAFVQAMSWSYHTKIPLLQSYEPRLPFCSALSSIQMLADSTIRKTRLDDMNEKPLLLIYTNEELTQAEKWVKDRSKLLLKTDQVNLASIDVNVFKESHQNWLNYAHIYKNRLKGNDTIKSDVSLQRIYYNGFDQFESKNIFAGEGAVFEKKKNITLFDEILSKKGLTGQYELSYWVFFDTRMYDMPIPVLSSYDIEENELSAISLNNREIHNIYNNWVRVNYKFNIEKGIRYKLEITGPYTTIDELLIKPVNSNVWIKKFSGTELLNNFVMD